MISEFVLDGSVTLAWCFEDECSPGTDEILDWLTLGATAFVPSLWHLEITNALWVSERRKRTSESVTQRFLIVLNTLPIITDNETVKHATTTTLGLAREHHLSVYDAAYLELAMRLGVALATKDDALKKASATAGVTVLP